jgi:3-dehydroquinate dehydratase-2
MEVVFRQSNHEGVLIDWIHEARGTAAGLIINPAGFVTSSSMAIPEALKAFAKPTIEIHISNTHKREEFRHSSRVSAVVTGIVSGFGSDGYLVALQAMAYLLAKSAL